MTTPHFETTGQQMSSRPFVTTVRKIIDRDRKYGSFDGKSAWYGIPAHLVQIIEEAEQERRTIGITTSRTEVLTVELMPVTREDRPFFRALSGLKFIMALISRRK
jgi:hypothetical protein